jgi:hypothetical protein
MGEVYRARDTALHREVALKILPAAVAGDSERIARFRREAQVLALLNHPHIAQIYELEEGPDLPDATGTGQAAPGAALVMELVQGEDLAARMARGAVPIDEALAIARQVADALDAAHSAGIVHRDLKPANVKVRPDGGVKVLDFGLAKVASSTRGAEGAANSPTVTSPAMTRAGIILGTAAYMSPEQARGKPIDKRADIWAFGCLLYEMLTGRAPFEGETITDVLGAIVKSEPDWTRLPSDTPGVVARLLRRCLQKDVAKRLRDIGDAVGELLPDAAQAPETRPPGPALGRTSRRLVAGGGEPREVPVTYPDGVVDLHDLEALPGGAFLAAVHRTTGVDAIGVVRGGSLSIVLEASGVRHPSYAAPGYLIFERQAPNAGLWAAPFSIDRLTLSGEPFPIDVGTEPTVALDGTLAFLGEPENLARQLSWFSLDGRVGARLAEPRDWLEGVSISPDSRRVLASAADGIWAYDVETGARSRVTSGATDITPDWVNEDTMVFVRTVENAPVVMTKRLRGDGQERVIARHARFPRSTSDGRRIVFNQHPEGQPAWEVAWVDLDRPADVHRLGPAHAGARFPSVSPDSSLVAYISGETGRDEIFLTRFPSGEGKWQLSTEGGGWTLFSPRGDSVFYRAPDGAFMSVAVGTSRGDVRVGPPRRLFDWGDGWMLFYDVARDAQRGVAAVPVERTNRVLSVSVVRNWHRQFPSR